ncbi:MAG: PTS trehalose transporter subunit IIBC [Sporolactobacillus sp.]|jgi:PTS system trehalose-specific IIC component|nr:PTS trehalose transporter subunit IIBC [Sporolactobacillus sp.]
MEISEEKVEKIIRAVGGAENILAVTHCITRLRFSLKDEKSVNLAELKKIDLVKGTVSTNGQFQVVIGQGTVDKVYAVLIDLIGLNDRSSAKIVNRQVSNRPNWLQRFVSMLADVFIPILPAIVTAGLLLGLNNLLVGKGIFYAGKSFIEVHNEWAGFSEIVNLIASTAFTFLPALIGGSAAKRFGGSPLLGFVLGLILVNPQLPAANTALAQKTVAHWQLFGFDVNKIGYQGQVLPILVATWILAKIEIYLKKRVYEPIQLLVVAPLSLLITGFAAFIIIGPVTLMIGQWITAGILALFAHFGAIAGFLYAGINALLVITGMHHMFIALDVQLIASVGMTYLWPVRVMSNIAQGSSALAMAFVTRDKSLKGTAVTSAVSAYLGVTEPAMFGVNIRYKYPFICAMIGAAFAGGLVAANGVKGTIGVGGIPAFLNVFPKFWGLYFIATGLAILIPFVLTVLWAVLFKRKTSTRAKVNTRQKPVKPTKEVKVNV